MDVLGKTDATSALARRLTLGEPSDGELALEIDGRAFLATVSTVHSSEGQTMGRVALLQDVTELKQLDRLKSEFVAGISHDLLSPLTYMHNYASLLPVAGDPALEKEYAEKILGGIDRMKQLVNDLLDLARIEAGLNLQLDRVLVGELLTEIAHEYAAPAKAQGVRLIVEAGQESVTADPDLLRRAVTNLVVNGLKYAPGSGPLTLRVEADNGEVVISVRDRGPGIAPADRARLFEKFYRGEREASERARGSGLGLAIVRSVADHHGGRAWCESAVGEGSVFYLALPAAVTSRNSPSAR
jgi:signal transduction histidine kinase